MNNKNKKNTNNNKHILIQILIRRDISSKDSNDNSNKIIAVRINMHLLSEGAGGHPHLFSEDGGGHAIPISFRWWRWASPSL